MLAIGVKYIIICDIEHNNNSTTQEGGVKILAPYIVSILFLALSTFLLAISQMMIIKRQKKLYKQSQKLQQQLQQLEQ